MYERLKSFFNALATDPQRLADYHLDRETALEAAGLSEDEKEVFRLESACPTCVTALGPFHLGGANKIVEDGSREIHIHIHHK
jgi:hypothetical protein